jgi:hypothetical protein
MAWTTIDDPEAHFQVVKYTGNGAANNAITLPGDTAMQPDFVWIKNRDATDSHCLFDAVRGATKVIHMDNTDAETTDTDTLDSFTSDGFQVDADVKVNTNAEKYVAWCWKANGTGSSNTNGSINTTATSANTTAGFSINTYTGTGSAATIGHGLGKVPTLIISIKRSATKAPLVYSPFMGNDYEMYMDRDSAASAAAATWNSTTPTSAVWSVATDSNNTGSSTQVAYVFTDIQGFSKFGSYEGNGNADGTFVYTGFRPALVITKSLDSTSAWHMFDNKREGFNTNSDATPESTGNDALVADDTTVEATTDMMDLLSNGFKLRIATDPNVAETYIYAAFAEAPFVNSNGVPCNGR